MKRVDRPKVESNDLRDFAKVMQGGSASLLRPSPDGHGEVVDLRTSRMNLDENNVRNGLGRLVLTLVKLLHELLERQAIKRIDAGYLTETEIERLGVTLMTQAREIDRLRKEFGLDEKDLNLDLGPLGKLL